MAHLSKRRDLCYWSIKHPNYFKYNKDINHIFVDEVLSKLTNNKQFTSKIFSSEDQKLLANSIEKLIIIEGIFRLGYLLLKKSLIILTFFPQKIFLIHLFQTFL